MARPQSLSVVLAERPAGDIVPGRTFGQKFAPAPAAADLKDGEILAETLYISLDPTMRVWLKDVPSYLPPVQVGDVMRGAAVARVVASRSAKAAAGDVVQTYSGWREVAVLPEPLFEAPFAHLPASCGPADLLGIFGTTGLTAYFGLDRIAQVRPGDTVVVSGAAGGTGSVVGQIAKMQGARVVGIAGSEDKTKWLVEDLGFDVGLNYRDPEFRRKFKDATPDMIDVYWDNVGGEILDMALARANKFARFVMCGGISQYNSAVAQGPKNINRVISMRIKMQGFIILDFAKEYDAARKELAKWVADGKIKPELTVVPGGLPAAEAALLELFKGANKGKMVVEVKSPDDSPKL